MADSFLNPSGLQRIWTRIKNYVDGKFQIASDGIDALSDEISSIPIINVDGTSSSLASDIWSATTGFENCIVVVEGGFVSIEGSEAFPNCATNYFTLNRTSYGNYINAYDICATAAVSAPASGAASFTLDKTYLSDILNLSLPATDSMYGTVKLNPTENVTLNSDGQLAIGGRLGQTAQGGLFYPLTSVPVQGSSNSLLLSEAVGLSIGARSMSIAGGNNVTLKVTAQAGATTYQISNTQNNRFICACWTGGRLATSQAGAEEKTVSITSVKFANGNNVAPYFGATEANNNIIVTVDETLNPSGTLTAVRGYGKWSSTDTLSVGQGNGSVGGKTLLVGQALYTNPGGQNQIAMIGNRMYTTKGSCIVVGADNINTAQFGAVFGEGHDTTGGPNGIALFGRYSRVGSGTLMAVGNGTSDTTRKNAFEVRPDGIVIPSPNGTRYLISVDDSGNLKTATV